MEARRASDESLSPVLGFGLFDGHGESAEVADRCKAYLLNEIREKLQDSARQGGVYASECEEECVRNAFLQFQGTLREEFKEARVGSTGIVVLVAPATLQEEMSVSALPTAPESPMSNRSDFFPGTSMTEVEVGTKEVKVKLEEAPAETKAKATAKATRGPSLPGSPVQTAGSPRSVGAGISASMEDLDLGAAVLRDTAVPFGAARLTCAWVGDSRAIAIFPDGSVQALSADHRLEDLAPGGERERVLASVEDQEHPGQRDTVVARRQCTRTGQMGPEVVFNEITGREGGREGS